MKKQLLIGLIITFFYNVKAQERIATFFAQDGDKFWIIMDGIKQNEKPSANVKVIGLTNDYYRVKVIFENEQLKSIDQNMGTVGFVDDSQEQKPADVVYNIKRKKKGDMVMRVSSFKPASSSKAKEPQQEVINFHAQPNSAPQTSTNSTTVTTTTTSNNSNENAPVNINVGVNTNGINMNMSGGNSNTGASSTTVTTSTTTTSSSSTINNNTQLPKNKQDANTPLQTVSMSEPRSINPCSQPMKEQSFNQLKASIEKQSFASNKMQVAKQGIKACLGANQIKELIKLFSFEQDKLDFAKYAYDYCINKAEYYIINDAFNFSSSVDGLNEYIQSKEK